MSDAATQLLPTLLALSPEDRVELVDRLQESIPFEIDDALRAELLRRKTGFEAGERPSIPAAEMFRRLRAERA